MIAERGSRDQVNRPHNTRRAPRREECVQQRTLSSRPRHTGGHLRAWPVDGRGRHACRRGDTWAADSVISVSGNLRGSGYRVAFGEIPNVGRRRAGRAGMSSRGGRAGIHPVLERSGKGDVPQFLRREQPNGLGRRSAVAARLGNQRPAPPCATRAATRRWIRPATASGCFGWPACAVPAMNSAGVRQPRHRVPQRRDGRAALTPRQVRPGSATAGSPRRACGAERSVTNRLPSGRRPAPTPAVTRPPLTSRMPARQVILLVCARIEAPVMGRRL